MTEFSQAKGRLALVTGATRLQGIGFAICRALAEAGTDIAFTHHSPYDRTTARRLGRIGLPQDAAKLVAFLCSDDAAWITGQVLHSHGGFR